MKKTVYITYDEHFLNGGEVCAGEEGERFANHEPSYWHFSAEGAYLEKPENSYCWDSFEVEAEKTPKYVYAVVVRYQTGDTFGSSHGRGMIEAVFADKDKAAEVADLIQKDDDAYQASRWPRRGRSEYKPLYGSAQGYKTWQGYFERLEGVTVVKLRLEQKEE